MVRTLLLCILIQVAQIGLGTPEDYKSGQVSTTVAFDYEANIIFHAIDFPLTVVQDIFTKNIFKTIDKLYGPAGLNLQSQQVDLIKKTYLYLIFLVKIEKVKNNTQFKAYQSDFAEFLQDNNQQMPHIPTEKLITSPGWKNVILSQEDLVLSDIWQKFCKSMIAKAYGTFGIALNIIHNVECQTFNYIPHIETSFYDHDYTNLRHINEMMRLKIILEQTTQKYFLQQITDWKSLPTINPKEENQNKTSTLEQAIVNFKKTKFYTHTNNIYALLGIPEKSGSTISKHQLMSPQQLTSPLKEEVWCCFMLKEIQAIMYGQINMTELEKTLTICSSKELAPNVFAYSSDDFVYYEELLAIKSMAEDNNKTSIHPTPTRYKAEETHAVLAFNHERKLAKKNSDKKNQTKDVQAQGLFSFLKHSFEAIGHAIVHTVEDVGHAIKDAAEAVAHVAEGAAEGIVGLGASIIGNIVDSDTLKNFGTQEEKAAINNMETATKDLQKTVDNITKAAENYASIDYTLYGDLAAIITDDAKLGESVTTTLNQLTDSFYNIGDKMADAAIQVTSDYVVSRMKVTMQFATLVANSIGAVYNQDERNEWLDNAQGLLNVTLQSITSSFSNLVSASKAVMGAVVQALGAIMNSLTTLFIDISREIFFIIAVGLTPMTGGASLAAYYALKADNKSVLNTYMNHTTNVLEAHRQTINQVMGAVVAIAFTGITEFATAGGATGVDVEVDAMLIGGGEAATEAATSVAAETTTEVAAETTAEAATDTSEDVVESAGNMFKNAEQEVDQENAIEDAGNMFKDAEEDAENPEEESADEAKAKGKEEGKWKQNLKRGLHTTLKALGNVMNIVFGFFSGLSGLNADQKAANQEKNEEKQLTNMWKFINDNKLSLIQQQSAYLEELQEKQLATIGNQTLSLAFMQNIVYAGINQASQQISTILTEQLLPMLTPDKNDMLAANIGTTWGIVSPYLNLYPSEGYSVATTGRPDFPYAQEVAQAPYRGNASSSGLSGKESSKHKDLPAKMWFNQKVTALDNTHENGTLKQPLDPLNVEIDLEFIYTINGPFYVGLYLGGDYHNYSSDQYLANIKSYIEQLKKEKITGKEYNDKLKAYIDSLPRDQIYDIDAAHLAKMVVLFRSSAQGQIQVGIYENEGKNWIVSGEPLPANMQFDKKHTYHMSTNLDKENLTISIWVDNDQATAWKKTVSVTELENQRTYGIIASGAAIQWNQKSPTPRLLVNTQARPPLNKTTEIEREKKSKIKILRLSQPTFGQFKLKPISKKSLLFGHYLYTTENTDLKKLTPQNSIDYVIFATNRNGKISNLGLAPDFDNSQNAPNVMVSVITGNAYDTSGNIVAHTANVWQNYNQAFGPFDQSINSYITRVRQQLIAGLAKITFGSFDLDIINQQALEKGQFVYTSTQTIDEKDSQGNPIKDYLIFAELKNNTIGRTIGLPPHASNAQGMVSLVTGNLFAKNTVITPGKTPQPIAKGYAELTNYEEMFNLDQTDVNSIQTATAAYFAALKALQKVAAAKKKPIIKVFPIHQASSTSMASSTGGISLGGGPGSIPIGSPPAGNINDLQESAAGSAGIQFSPPASPSISLGAGP